MYTRNLPSRLDYESHLRKGVGKKNGKKGKTNKQTREAEGRTGKELKEGRKTFLIVYLLEVLISPLRLSRYCHAERRNKGPDDWV